jgi:sulfite exporter TauE/SafE
MSHEKAKEIQDYLLGENLSFGVGRLVNLLKYCAVGGTIGYFASNKLKLTKLNSTLIGVGSVLLFFAGLQKYIETTKNKE